MVVKVKTVSGTTEIFETDKYVISTKKELHPDILEGVVFTNNGKRLKKIKRYFQWLYKKFLYKPVNETLTES